MATQHYTEVNDTIVNIRANADSYQNGFDTTNSRPFHTNETPDLIYEYACSRTISVATGASTYLSETFLNITLNDSLMIENNIVGNGDSDTYLERNADEWKIHCGGVEMVAFTETTQDVIEFNSANADVDFIVNASGVADAFVVDGATGKIGFGVSDPYSKMELKDGSFYFTDSDVDTGLTDTLGITDAYGALTIGSGTGGGMYVWGASDAANITGLGFFGIIGNADPTDTIPAIRIDGRKKNGTGSQAMGAAETVLQIQTYSSALITVLGNGNMGLGCTAPVSIFEIQDGLTTEGAVLTLGTKETTVVANDVLGRINFYAPLEADGSDAILVGASIAAVAEDTFAADNNKTSLYFQTGASEAATTKAVLTSAGYLGVNVTDPDTLLELLHATTQQKWSHDADSAITFGCDANSDGTFTFDSTGDTFMWASPNVSHGVTDILPTNVPFALGTYVGSGGDGGLIATGIYDGDGYGISLTGIIATASPLYAGIKIKAAKINGTGIQALADAEDICVVYNNADARWTLEGDGDVTMVGDLNVAAGKDIRSVAYTSWTPTISSVSGTVPQYDTTACRYKRVGRRVFFEIYLNGDGGNEGSGTDLIEISLPVAPSSYSATHIIGYGDITNGATYNTILCFWRSTSSLEMHIQNVGVVCNDQNNMARQIRISGNYEAE